MQNISTRHELEDRLSEPTQGVLDALGRCPGDLIVLGVGGKMGPTLARMARRAFDLLGRTDRVIGVARFSNPDPIAQLRTYNIEPVTCDLLERTAVQRLPDAANVLFLAGQKFGTASGPELTWAMNTLVPAHCAERYAHSRIVAFSTGCVYPLVPVTGGGATEDTEIGTAGDYPNSCIGRERIFTFFSRRHDTPVAIVRLNYAIDLRYGVLLDVANKVWKGEPVDVTMGHVNIIWQRDANANALQCLAHAAAPPFIVNITGPETLSVRSLAHRLGELLGRPAIITGQEAETAWVSNAGKARALFGPPSVGVDQMIRWTAHWIQSGNETLNKPTHFEVRNGQF